MDDSVKSKLAAMLGVSTEQFEAGAARGKEVLEVMKRVISEFPTKQPETMEEKHAFIQQYAKWDAQFPKDGPPIKLSKEDAVRQTMYESCLTAIFGNTDEISKLFDMAYAGYLMSKKLAKHLQFYPDDAGDTGNFGVGLSLGDVRDFNKVFEK